MVMSDSIDTAACSSPNTLPRGPPGSLNKSARCVNHVALLRDQREGGSGEGGDGEEQPRGMQ